MKILHFLAGLALFNLIAIAIITSSSNYSDNPIVIPTPRVVIKKVVKSTEVKITASPASNPSNCIVTIDGTRYDITSFKNDHSGGDIFTCGSDMSAAFWSRHGNRQLFQMQRYRI